jgi:hypothetical protein
LNLENLANISRRENLLPIPPLATLFLSAARLRLLASALTRLTTLLLVAASLLTRILLLPSLVVASRILWIRVLPLLVVASLLRLVAHLVVLLILFSHLIVSSAVDGQGIYLASEMPRPRQRSLLICSSGEFRRVITSG